MWIRMNATGQVEDFVDEFARAALNQGIATKVDGPGKRGVEVAAVQPKQETASLSAPTFKRG
jgi:hypothetical protein